MSDTQEQSLTVITSPTGTYYVRLVNDAGGTPESVLITRANLLTAAAIAGVTLTAPTIADFTNAAHDHGDADDGGVLVAAAIGLTTQGDIVYRDSSGIARLAAGTSGQGLKTGGSGANPSWSDFGYVLFGSSDQNVSPADSTTYYFGTPYRANLTTTANVRKITVPRAGTITRVDLVSQNVGTAGSNETSTMSLRLNNTTDTSLTTSFTNNAATDQAQFFSATGLSIAVAVGDTLEFKWATPAWATNPQFPQLYGAIFIR